MDKQQLKVVYEDNHLLVVVKPQNVLSQADSTNDADMLTLCKQYLKEQRNKQGEVFVGLVHRLDRPTGGLMVFAKTSKCASRLSEQIRNGEFRKEYLTVVLNKPREESAKLTHYLKKDEINNVVRVVPMFESGAKKCELVYKTLQFNNKLSLLNVRLLTGRSHQIRVQMSTIGNAIFGDVKYKGDVVKGYNLALWAYKLTFIHPTTKKVLNFVCYPPEDEIPWSYFNWSKKI